jgi:drug/metabolite transporter (DMT)-like permease
MQRMEATKWHAAKIYACKPDRTGSMKRMTLRAANPPVAIAFMLTATAFIAATMLLAKSLGTDTLGAPLHPLQISHGRFLFAFLAIGTTAVILRPKIANPHLGLHIGRTVFGWGGVTLMFAAVAFIPLSDATAISFLNPVFGMLLAIPLLGEKVGPWRWLAAFTALIGALILLRPGPDTFQLAGLLALGAAVIMGMELIFIKKLANREPSFQILLINNAIGLCIATLAVLPVWSMPTLAQWGALAALGMLMATAQACFINAMARADASFITPFSYVTLIFATLYDLLIFDVWPDWISILGAVIILGGASLLAWRERRVRA